MRWWSPRSRGAAKRASARAAADPEGLYSLSPGVLLRCHGGETLILDTRSGSFYKCRSVGTCVLEAARDGATLNDVLAAVREGFTAVPATLEWDVRAFLGDLLARGLIKEVQARGTPAGRRESPCAR